jgi:rhodanese-related sulfurtransferase
MKKVVLALCLLLIISFPALSGSQNMSQRLHSELQNYQSYLVPLPQAKEIHGRGAVFLDIRSAASYGKGHIPNALNIPATDLPQAILEKPGILPKKQPVYIICCAQDRNAMYALLPLRMAGYDAYAVTGGGTDAWIHLKWPAEGGSAKSPEAKYNTKLSDSETVALAAINPAYHMMKAGRSYAMARTGLEKYLSEGNDLFVVEIASETVAPFPYAKQRTALSDLPLASWLQNLSKNQTVYLVGEDDKELTLGMVSLRMLGYDAVFAVKK